MGKSERYLARIDGRLLRALSHPLRVRLLELLRDDGPATASGLGKRLGESSGTTSWHLRQLAESGLIAEDAERGSRRDRWWKAVREGDRMPAADFVDDPGLAGDSSLSLTPGEAAALRGEILELIKRYRRPAKEGDTQVRVHWAAVPRKSRPETP
ncbi:winged helix-turn-helix domain-containing protein [Amycolatopsis keratiniphila]|uniref:Transcriptional regulator n=1 Tax=Amycolatopsis keratiniphila subsp. keratiniphila TaxID=227715 RepID=A0A1W2LU77_9PSEU|nr:helix-turn-helix domain-containing protein [Amycolatopsis keratiniphila]OLZ61478.1 transcriptional regulator [Amycolatopsis keratiniphila subsp. nogabecina]ONF68910.1 transcriptional regulator [Amycolatopsis keratiniphila subsp. keratiniphila]SDU19679.1 Helix-turn-helix domain-containing protein [Amycolatopsis keratiniphila]